MIYTLLSDFFLYMRDIQPASGYECDISDLDIVERVRVLSEKTNPHRRTSNKLHC